MAFSLGSNSLQSYCCRIRSEFSEVKLKDPDEEVERVGGCCDTGSNVVFVSGVEIDRLEG